MGDDNCYSRLNCNLQSIRTDTIYYCLLICLKNLQSDDIKDFSASGQAKK